MVCHLNLNKNTKTGTPGTQCSLVAFFRHLSKHLVTCKHASMESQAARLFPLGLRKSGKLRNVLRAAGSVKRQSASDKAFLCSMLPWHAGFGLLFGIGPFMSTSS